MGNIKKIFFFRIYCPLLNVEGMAIFPFILTKRKNPPEVLINHECIHLAQQVELFILPFYVWYLLEYCWHRLKGKTHQQAYLNISFEKEAYINDDNLQYLANRKRWGFMEYV